MRALLSSTLGVIAGLAGLTAHAQQQMPVLPVDMFACNFVNGSDMSDFNRAFEDYNEWADEAGIDSMTSYALSPSFFSEDFEYDVIGLNIWPDGAAFGSGYTSMTTDPDSLGMFAGVVECPVHALYALVGVKPPASDPQSGSLWEFTNCTLKGNRSDNEGVAAVAAVAELFEQWNINDAHAALFNLAGHPSDVDYQFKWITYYPSYEAWGSLFDGIIGDGAVPQIGAIIDPVMSCDSSRIYGMSLMRSPAAE